MAHARVLANLKGVACMHARKFEGFWCGETAREWLSDCLGIEPQSFCFKIRIYSLMLAGPQHQRHALLRGRQQARRPRLVPHRRVAGRPQVHGPCVCSVCVRARTRTYVREKSTRKTRCSTSPWKTPWAGACWQLPRVRARACVFSRASNLANLFINQRN